MASAGGAARKRKKNQEKKYEGEEGKKKNPFEINNEEARGIEQDLFAREPPSKVSYGNMQPPVIIRACCSFLFVTLGITKHDCALQ